jgi:hypothetical protein
MNFKKLAIYVQSLKKTSALGADRMRNFKQDRTGPDQEEMILLAGPDWTRSGRDDPVGRTGPDRIQITEKKF